MKLLWPDESTESSTATGNKSVALWTLPAAALWSLPIGSSFLARAGFSFPAIDSILRFAFHADVIGFTLLVLPITATCSIWAIVTAHSISHRDWFCLLLLVFNYLTAIPSAFISVYLIVAVFVSTML